MALATENENVVNYRSAEGAQVTHIRRALLGSSIQTLKAMSLLPRYLERLPCAYREELLAPVTPGWASVALAEIHYGACRDMALSAQEIAVVAQSVLGSVTNTLLGTFTRSIRTLGGNPWHSLAQSERLFTRMYRGGATCVTRRGPKEALIEVSGSSLFENPYFAMGHCALLKGGALLFAKTAYVRQLSADKPGHRAVLAWV